MIVMLNVIRKGLAQITNPLEVGVPVAKLGLMEPLFIDQEEFQTWAQDYARKPRVFVPQTKAHFLPDAKLMEVATSVRIDGDDMITVLETPREIGLLMRKAAESGFGEEHNRDRFSKNVAFLWECQIV